MPDQNYKNHVRYYPAHHFVFYPLTFLMVALSVWSYRKADEDERMIWMSIGLLWVAMIWLSFMLRQHYALICQNRIVRLELRFRYFVITGARLEPKEKYLSFKQLAALRFASDEELSALVNEAIEKNLSSDQIKKSIRNWQADHMRV